MSGFPLYAETPLVGPYHVSLSIPGPLSNISKSVGATSSTNLLIPNIDYLQKFVKGDIGIGDSILKNLISKNFNSPIASKNEDVFRQFAKLNKIEIDDINKYKKGDKFVMPTSEIKLDSSFDKIGIKSIEKTILTSIFETQKPYVEVAKLVLENLANIEDIIARIMPLVSVSPLSSKSEKPRSNKGNGKLRPKSLGYKSGEELKTSLSKIESYLGGEKKSDTSNKSDGQVDNTGFEIISEIYSTGEFDPNVEYKYTYIDLPVEGEFKDIETDINIGGSDPYNKYKPKKLIFGIYNSKGEPLNPNEVLKTISLSGTNVIETNTPFKKADWILRSPKWYLPNGIYQWPTYGDPIYIWEKGSSTRESRTNPNTDADPAWRIKKYKDGDKDLITKEDAIPGNPMIVRFETNQELEYRNYFNEYVRFKFYSSELTSDEKIRYTNDIMNQLDIQSHLQNVFLYGQVKSSYYERINDKDPIPSLLKKSFKPYQIFSTEASNDDNFRKFFSSIGKDPGFIWIEPEADYDMKVIRVDPATRIEYKEAEGESEARAEIQYFIKNRSNFILSDGSSFNVDVLKNGTEFESLTNITSYSLDNWNYENSTVFNDNTFILTVWSENAPSNIPNRDISYKVSNNDNITYKLVKESDGWFYKRIVFDGTTFNTEPISEGDIILFKNTTDGPNNRVRLDSNGKIIRWYYLYNRELVGPSSKTNITRFLDNVSSSNTDVSSVSDNGDSVAKDYLPTFSVIRNFTINTNSDITLTNLNYGVSYLDESTTLYNIRINTDDKYGALIDPSKITNDKLTTNDLYVDVDGKSDEIDRKYGHGSVDNPQRVKVIKRYKLTDLDNESYFIVEGTLKSAPESEASQNSGANSSGEEWYTIADSIGAFKVFLDLLINVFSKLLPNIQKLLELLKNPLSFISTAIGDKLQDNVLFLSKDTLNSFKEGINIKDGIREVKPDGELQDTSSPINVPDTDKAKKIKELREHFKNSNLSNYVYVNDNGGIVSLLDGFSSIPFDIFGKSLNFGMNLELAGKTPLSLLKDINIKNVKNLQKEILNRPEGREGSQPNTKSFQGGTNNDKVQIKFQNGSSVFVDQDSLDEFIIDNKTKYNFVYVDEGIDSKISESDELVNKGDILSLSKAKDKLNEALKSRPNDINIQNKIKDVDSKLGLLKNGQQPLLKMIMGIVSVPLKIVGGIIEYILNFFKGLVNPITLPSKIVEFLSFKWLFKWFVPPTQGNHPLLEMAGMKFNFKKESEWKSMVNRPGPFTNKLPKSLKLPADIKIKGFNFNKIKAGKYALDDDAPAINMGEALRTIFTIELPKFTPLQFRQAENSTGNLMDGFLCFIEKLINSIIDFFWSLLGLEAIKESPHIKLCNENKAEDESSIIKNDKDQNLEQFVYEVKLPDGSKKEFLNRVELDKFIEDNKDLNYDFNF